MRTWLAPVLLAGACAGANPSMPPGPDAHIFLDAPGPDAALPISLNQTADTTVNGGPTICVDSTMGSPTKGNTFDDTWYRAFQLSDYPDIHGGMHVSTIVFGIDAAKNAGMVTVSIGSYTGDVGGTTLDLTQVTPLASAMAYPPDSGASELSVPLDTDIPAGGKFVVSIASPNIVQQGYFYLGGTTAPETHPGFWSSNSCPNSSTPIVQDMNHVTSHMIITVAGTH